MKERLLGFTPKENDALAKLAQVVVLPFSGGWSNGAASGVVSVVQFCWVFARWCGCWLVLVVRRMMPRRFGCV